MFSLIELYNNFEYNCKFIRQGVEHESAKLLQSDNEQSFNKSDWIIPISIIHMREREREREREIKKL